MDRQYDQQEDFFFNRLITDFEPRVLRLNDSRRKRRADSKHENAWCFKVIFNRGSWVSIRSNGIGVEERHSLKTLHAALWRISNWLVGHINLKLFLVTNSTSVLIFVLVIFTRACNSGSSSSKFFETFTMAHFVVKPMLRSNRQSWAFKKHIVKRERKFGNQNFSSLKRKRKFRDQNFLSSKRKRKFRNQNLKSLKRNCKFRNENSKRFKAQTQIPQSKIENSTVQLQIDCLRSALEFRYLKKFLSTNFCIIEVSKARCRRWCYVQKYESSNIAPSSAKLYWNKPTVMSLAFITKGTYLSPKKELFLLLKKAIKH